MQPGTELASRYVLVRQLGRGGLATAWAADDTLRNSRVALKLLRAAGPDAGAALRDEFRLLRGLHHPRLATALDLGVVRGEGPPVPFYTARLIDGEPWSKRPPADFAQARTVLVDVLAALSFLHRASIRHGDVKPENVLVGDDGRAVLIDLSCARRFDAPAAESIAGTEGFIAPELIAEGTADGRADLYAVGVVLRGLAASVTLPKPVATIAEQLVSDDPAARPPRVEDVLDALDARTVELGPPIGRSPRLVGRQEELAEVRGAISALRRGEPGPRAFAIVGPPGVGRSRLLDELKWEAQDVLDVVEASSGQPLRDAMARRFPETALPSGLEGVVAAARLDDGRPWALILDDAQELVGSERRALAAFVRSLGDSSRALVLAASTDESGFAAGPDLRTLRLRPLEPAAVAEWAGDTLSDAGIERLVELTAGHPADVEAVLARLAAGEIHEADLRGQRAATLDGEAVRSLPDAIRGELVRLACAQSASTRRAALPIGAEARAELARAGWIAEVPEGFSLARPALADAIVDAVPEDEAKQASMALAEELAESAGNATLPMATRADALGVRVILLSRAGAAARAARELELHRDIARTAPDRLSRAADLLAAVAEDRSTLLACVRTLRAAGAVGDASARLASWVRARPRARDASVYLEAAEIALAGSRPAAARRHARRVHERDPETDEAARAHDILARSFVLDGRYADARREAEAGLALSRSEERRGSLHEAIALSAIFGGDPDAARAHLTSALDAASTHRDRVRLLSYRALLDGRAGRLDEARRRYAEALSIAEQQGLADQLASAALNMGTIAQQLGDWGAALASYQRALRLSTALARHGSVRTLRFNIANLEIAIGAFASAELALETLAAEVEAAGRTQLVIACALARGDGAVQRGRLAEAVEHYRRARAEAEKVDARREILEADVASSAAERRDAAAVAELVRRAREEDAHDLVARALLIQGRAALTAGRPSDAAAAFEEALTVARTVGDRALVAESEGELSIATDDAGEADVAAAHRARARRSWDRIGVSLPPEYRDAFRSHPLRAKLGLTTRSHSHRPMAGDDVRRVLEINKRLNSSLSSDEVLACAIDAAIELTGAERGFVIVGNGPDAATSDLVVAIARNLERERIGRDHLQFSRSIAERVVRDGQPIVATDARGDSRFRDNASVHAMKLSSVLCVPIESPDGVLGAIYLDNRVARGRFDRDSVALLMAFSDQVAIALRNARLHASLRERTDALVVEQKRVAALLEEREREIDRLRTETKNQREILDYRYDYTAIVGRGAAMRRVLSILERVIDSPLSVLIEGESGTGKELIARAIHVNGPRRDGRFVAVNCGALPEALLEAELFGYVRGAFTGADADKKGLLAAASGGTVFFDEVGEMPPPMQAKLLRALEAREIRPLGGAEDVPIDIRVVSATNRDLSSEIEHGRFREDLFYRLAVVRLPLPPLRERIEDLPELARALVERHAEELGREPPAIGAEALRELLRRPWPGNVRELSNVISRALVMSDGPELGADDLAPEEGPGPRASKTDGGSGRTFEEEEAALIEQTLRATRWNVSEVSRRLGIPRNTLYRKLERYGLKRSEP